MVLSCRLSLTYRNMKEMFSDAGLTELDLSKFNTENVTDMSYMFAGSNKLKTLDLSNFITSSVTHIGGMFSGCSGLKTLNISNFNTVNVTNMASVFEACSSLTELNLTHFDTSKVFDMYQMFRGCQNLEELNVSSFNTSNVTNMHGMFEGCAALKTLDLSNFNTSKVTDMTQMFAMITVTNSVEEKLISNLITIYVGETFTVGDKTASEEMFKYCERLVGGNGTTYDSNYIGKDYARIDGVDSKKGYFTADPQGQE